MSKKDSKRTAPQGWFEDGLIEITAGLMLAVFGMYYFVPVVIGPVAPDTATATLVGAGHPLAVFGCYTIASRVAGGLRLRWSGHGQTQASIHRIDKRQAFLFATLLVIGMGLVMAAFWSSLSNLWWWALAGAILSLLFAFIGLFLGLPRFYPVAIFTFLWGLIVAGLRFSDSYPIILFACGVGASWMVSGGTALLRYWSK